MKQAAIYLYDRKAGLLIEDETGYTFRYDADYLRLPDAEAVGLTQPLKVVLVEQNRTGKWFAEQLGQNEATISRWCSNSSQPSLEMLVKIASVLNVDPREHIKGK